MLNAHKLDFHKQAFVNEYIKNGGNGTQAVMKVYPVKSPEYAGTKANRLIKNDDVQQSIEEKAANQGVTHEVILQRFNSVSEVEPEKVGIDAKLRATENLAKILNMYPGTKHARLNINMKGKLPDMSFQQIKDRHQEIDQELTLVLEDKTPQTIDP